MVPWMLSYEQGRNENAIAEKIQPTDKSDSMIWIRVGGAQVRRCVTVNVGNQKKYTKSEHSPLFKLTPLIAFDSFSLHTKKPWPDSLSCCHPPLLPLPLYITMVSGASRRRMNIRINISLVDS